MKFCCKVSKAATETVETVLAAYGNEALTRVNIFDCFGRFRGGLVCFQGDRRSGRPSESRTEGDIIEKFRYLLLQNRHLSLRIIMDELPSARELHGRLALEIRGEGRKKNGLALNRKH